MRVGACGKTKRKVGKVSARFWPVEERHSDRPRVKLGTVSPRPWRKMSVWVWGWDGGIVVVGRSMVMLSLWFEDVR